MQIKAFEITTEEPLSLHRAMWPENLSIFAQLLVGPNMVSTYLILSSV